MTAPSSHPLLARPDDDGRVLWLALGIAVTLHVSVVLFVALPELTPPVVPERRTAPTITQTDIPPPPPRERPVQQDHKPPERMLPVPDPDPERPEPIRERVHEEIDLAPPIDLPYVVGDPQPPPPITPFELSTAEIIPPELVPASKIEPHFPELARVARFSGRVTLRAIIDANGSVVEIEVLGCDRPGFGFEDAAIDAVVQWRYRPAMLRGRPVPVYLVVQVSFTLR